MPFYAAPKPINLLFFSKMSLKYTALPLINVYNRVIKVTLIITNLKIKIRLNANLVVKVIISHYIILLSFL